jgi:glycosyltransferase involved in cell wall biosynthesis
MSAPKVSICVPTIGRLEFLPGVKASIAAQTRGDFEVLVLDNGSPADVGAELETWARADARVRVLRSEARIPMWENFNRGVLGARGEYVAFCHDDDELCPTFIERNVAFMDSNPGVGFCGSNHFDIGPDGALLANRERFDATRSLAGHEFIAELMRTGRSPLAMQTVFFRRAVFPPGGFDPTVPRFFGDFILLMRMAESWRVGLIAEPLVRVRVHPGQASQMSLAESVPMRTTLFLSYLDELRGRGSTLDLDAFERQVRRAHVLHLGWGWLAASGTAEAHACARSIGAVKGLPLGAALEAIERVGPFRTARACLAGVVRKLSLR